MTKQYKLSSKWYGLLKWAGLIAELSNVHTRHRREADYLVMASETRRLALELSRETRAAMPNETRITELLGQLDTSCATCHDTL